MSSLMFLQFKNPTLVFIIEDLSVLATIVKTFVNFVLFLSVLWVPICGRCL